MNLIDIVILFVMNIVSDAEVSKSRSIGELMNYSLTQPMNLAFRSLAYFAVYAIVFGIWYKKAFAKDENPVKAIRENARKLTWRIVCLVVAGVLAQYAVDAVLELLREVSPESFTEYDEMLKNLVGVTASWVSLLASFIVAPIAEELIFRGVILGYSRQYLPDIAAIFLNALLFAVYHGNLIQGCYAFALGGVLAFIRVKTGSVIPGMLLHMCINTSILFMPKFEEMGEGFLIASMIAATVVFAVMIALTVKKPKEKQTENSKENSKVDSSLRSE
ncbi:MAG: CPBP family intramembrane metalloprotease [Lachnospiraceae bacterium]|nr:CPBP family intramembrane metalloprotease [Lachnospiraceae bacterium]